jgi:phosphoribosylformimino-5-aminoimidazole carboxamide ribotide isomerase
MKEFNVIPAIDLRFGKVVRLIQGKANYQTVFGNDPINTSQEWIEQGAQWLHVVNLNGAFGEDTSENEAAIKKIITTSKNKVKIQLGGGIRNINQIKTALNLGISRVVLGTAVIEDPTFGVEAIDKFGGDKIAFGLDAVGEELMSRGWQARSGLRTTVLAEILAKAGAQTLIYTNIQKDGMQTGVDLKNAKQLADHTGLSVLASGGTATLEDVAKVREAELAGVIIGRALYEGKFTLKEALHVH